MTNYNVLIEYAKRVMDIAGIADVLDMTVTTILCATAWLATRSRCMVVTGLAPVMPVNTVMLCAVTYRITGKARL